MNRKKVKIMINIDKRELLTSNLLRAKAEGLRVFINVPDEHNYYNYGILTDGTNIICVQLEGTLFITFFAWYPFKKNGSGCLTLESGCGYKKLTKEVFLEAVEYGNNVGRKYGVELYKSFNHFFNIDKWSKNHYIEL